MAGHRVLAHTELGEQMVWDKDPATLSEPTVLPEIHKTPPLKRMLDFNPISLMFIPRKL